MCSQGKAGPGEPCLVWPTGAQDFPFYSCQAVNFQAGKFIKDEVRLIPMGEHP